MRTNADIVKAATAAYEAEDFDALMPMLDPDVELHEWPEAPDQRVFHGRNAIFEAVAEWGKAWEHVRAETERIVEAGDHVLAFVRTIGKGRGSAIELELENYAVYTLRDHKITKLQYFTDRETALAAAGLTEDDVRQEGT